jgi:hypothetical protein
MDAIKIIIKFSDRTTIDQINSLLINLKEKEPENCRLLSMSSDEFEATDPLTITIAIAFLLGLAFKHFPVCSEAVWV